MLPDGRKVSTSPSLIHAGADISQIWAGGVVARAASGAATAWAASVTNWREEELEARL